MLSDADRRQFKGQAHALKPVVNIGKGDISEAVLSAVDDALSTHGLIKVKLLKGCSVDKNEAAAILSQRTEAALVQRIGRMIVLFRPIPESGDAT